MKTEPKPATGEWTPRFVMKERCIFDNKADAFVGLADACYLLDEAYAALAAERELVQWCPVHAPTKEEPIVCCPCCEAVHASDKLKATAGIAENVRLYDEVQQLRAQLAAAPKPEKYQNVSNTC